MKTFLWKKGTWVAWPAALFQFCLLQGIVFFPNSSSQLNLEQIELILWAMLVLNESQDCGGELQQLYLLGVVLSLDPRSNSLEMCKELQFAQCEMQMQGEIKSSGQNTVK